VPAAAAALAIWSCGSAVLLGLLALTMAVGANLNAQARPGPGEGPAAESLRVRRLAVVDANGVERVLFAAPLPPAGEG
jgi:hypothetical protein